MTLSAIIVYGSHARGDNEPDSDVDLLGIIRSGSPAKTNVLDVNITTYNSGYLNEQALMGDLFVLHLVKEGRALYDPFDLLATLKQKFCYKISYEQDVRRACELGWFLVQFSHRFTDKLMLNRRVTWVVRTVLIARAAERRAPIFSPAELMKHSGSHEAIRLISLRNSELFNDQSLLDLEIFLLKFGSGRKRYTDDPPEIPLIYKHLLASGNRFAAKTAAQLEGVFDPAEFYPE